MQQNLYPVRTQPTPVGGIESELMVVQCSISRSRSASSNGVYPPKFLGRITKRVCIG